MLTLTILTGLALLVLLAVLAWALHGIVRALQSAAADLEKIAAGVRAIERETQPLIRETAALNRKFRLLSDGFGSVEQTLRGMHV